MRPGTEASAVRAPTRPCFGYVLWTLSAVLACKLESLGASVSTLAMMEMTGVSRMEEVATW